ncbi:P-loop containing nucleoside triphosphate hydrolase protein, partial [Rhypophila decipiens]
MRLLSTDASEKLSFTSFKTTPPPYAILSHTWEQNNEEVLYEEVINGLGKGKRGYQKIEFCASQARQDNIQYFWVDTCCIDKLNDFELSKAINSMFHWYQNATKCYVVLSDVSVPDPTNIARPSTWESSFKASRWFTRGWTLQELIAPASIEFFSLEGHLLGDKRSLEHLICKITGIPAEVLRGGVLDHFSLSDMKEWAKNRQTSEPEDQIYSLLGLLNIFMTPSYGEGISNATKRLNDELARIELAKTGIKTNFFVPYARNDKFVGYEIQLAELEDMVLGGQQARKIAITGPGGIGKSQLALELAYRTQEKHKNCAVFWISATDMDSFSQACSYVAQKLAIPGWNDENEDARKILQLHLSQASTGKWLLIYDDADDASLGAGNETNPRVTNLLDFVPWSDHGCIIFTTASSNTAEVLAPENTIQLDKLAAETALQILRSHLTNSIVANEEQEVKHLLEELSCLPLAITQAAAYIKHNKISITRYLELLSEQKEKPTKPSDKQCGEQLQYRTTDNAVALTSLISLAQVSRHNITAANCLFFMACIDRKDVLLQLLPTTPSSPTRTTIDLLSTYAIIIKRPASSAIELHRLVHLMIRNYLQERGLFHQWNQEAISILAETFPSASHENRSKWRRLLPHAKHALADSSIEQGSDSTISLAIKYAIALYEDGHFDEAEKLFVQVMETSKTKLGADHPSTLTSM